MGSLCLLLASYNTCTTSLLLIKLTFASCTNLFDKNIKMKRSQQAWSFVLVYIIAGLLDLVFSITCIFLREILMEPHHINFKVKKRNDSKSSTS